MNLKITTTVTSQSNPFLLQNWGVIRKRSSHLGSSLSLFEFVVPKANWWTSVAGGRPSSTVPSLPPSSLKAYSRGGVHSHLGLDLRVFFSLDLERACVIGFPSVDRGLARFPSLRCFIGDLKLDQNLSCWDGCRQPHRTQFLLVTLHLLHIGAL